MAKDEFQLMRALATKYGVATPESNDDLYKYSLISSTVRAAKKYGQEISAARIEALETAINQTIGWIEGTNALRPEDGGESLRLLEAVITETKQ